MAWPLPPNPATARTRERKLKPAPLPELLAEEALRQALVPADTLAAPAAGPLPSASATPAGGDGGGAGSTGEGEGRGLGSAGEGEGADVVAVYEGGTVTRQQLQSYARDQLRGYSFADLDAPEASKIRLATGMLTRLVLDEVMLKEAEARGLSQREGVQQALRRLSEDENIAELAERVGPRIEVSNTEIADYWEKHRTQLKDVPPAQLQSHVGQIVHREKARAAFDAYLDRLKAQASIQRAFALLEDPGADPGAALFTVNGKAYPLAQWREELQRMTPEERRRCADPKVREQALESLVTRTLLLDAANTAADEGLRKRLEQIRRMLLIDTLYREQVDPQVQVTEAEVAQRYEQVKGKWQTAARARIAVGAVPTGRSEAERGKAAEVVARLRKAIADGASFTAAAEPLKADSPGLQVIEKTHWVGAADHLDDLFGSCPFHTRVFQTLAVGELSEPFLYGTHLFVVKVLEREEPRTPTREEIGGFLRNELRAAKRRAAAARYLNGVLDRAKIEIRPDALAGVVRPPVVTSPAFGGTRGEGRGTGPTGSRPAGQ